MGNDSGLSDPHALVVDDVCYLFTGHDVGFGISDWVMPDWRIYRSHDLRTWAHVGTISPADNYMGSGNTDCWAGDIVQRNGKYYWYFSNRKKNTGVMVASAPEGPFADALGHPLMESFDPSIFVDEDDTAYIVNGEVDYPIARLKDSMIELVEEPQKMLIDRKGIFPSTDKNSLHKHNGTYYLSCGGFYAVSRNVYGPYDYKGVVGKGLDVDTGYAHGDFFEWNGQWYHVWCKYRDRSKDRVRDCFIAPVTFEPDGKMWDDMNSVWKVIPSTSAASSESPG